MNSISRRTFIEGSVGALAALGCPAAVFAAPECVSGPPRVPAYVPTRVSVDCASRQNFRLFRENAKYLGLAGLVSMNRVQGKFGAYPAGNLFLFPWLKREGVALGPNKAWPSVVPTSPTGSQSASPIPNSYTGPDEYFCHFVLKAPAYLFIGFGVDVPFDRDRARTPQFTNLERLSDGQAIGVNWTSANLNDSYFAGSRMIPNDDQCSGKAWREAIIDGLQQVSARVC